MSPDRPLRLLHTADWQIGRMVPAFEPDDAAALFEARFAAIETLAALANEHEVDAVLVAGDVLDAQTVSDKTLRRTFLAMQAYRGPWCLLPGNHDAALAESVWSRAQRLGLLQPPMLALLEPRVHTVAGRFALLPAPLTQRHTQGDLTEWFDQAETPAGLLRIGLAHGCISGVLPDDLDAHNPIAAHRAASARLSYLALGDWHGTRCIDARTWYAGTPETDRFRANDSGQALLVTIHPPAAPTGDGTADTGSVSVEVLTTGRYRWRSQDVRLAVPSDADRLIEDLLRREARDVLQLNVSGVADMHTLKRLDAAVSAARAQVRAMVWSATALRLEPTDDDIAALHADGFVGEVVAQLRAEQADAALGQRARDALMILARLLDEVAPPPAPEARP
jgi:DNA repair exonuclease SbcCD nuclease subunit